MDGLRARLEEAERDLRSAERRAAQAAEEAEAMRTEVAQMKQAAEEREQHAHEAVRRLAQQCSRFERQAADAQLQQDALRLGSIGVQRTGTVLTEVRPCEGRGGDAGMFYLML